jgi:hypothetical protein
MPIFSLTDQKKRVHFFSARDTSHICCCHRARRYRPRGDGIVGPLSGPVHDLKPVAIRVLKKDRVVLIAVLKTMGRTFDIPSSRPSDHFTDSINLFMCVGPERDTSRVWLAPRIFGKSEEGLAGKQFRGRRAAPFCVFFTPPHRKTEPRQQSSIEVRHVREAADPKIDMTKWVSAHRIGKANGTIYQAFSW